ncbi:MAG: NAD(P)-dependent oxidoreductase [Bacteroidota bacterium]
MERVLITDGVHPLLIEGLEHLNYQIDYEPAIDPRIVIDRVPDYVGMIINSKITVDKAMLDAGHQLRFIGRLGSGMEIIDRVYAAEKGVAVLNSPEGNCNAVAEQALGMLLTLANNLLRADREVRQLLWRREANRGFELAGRTIGLIGFGHTGSSFAKKLSGMDMTILAYDKYKTSYTADFPYVEAVSQEELLARSEIVSLHLPLTAETIGMVDARFLQSCQLGAILINTSRGAIVQTADLLAALHSGHLKGACLDVFENEKPQRFTAEEKKLYQSLYLLDQVVLSPHIAGWTQESKRRLASILLERIAALSQ